MADIYEQLGMDLPTAFRMFMKKSKQVRGLPFDAVLPETNTREDFRAAINALREEASDVPEMTLEEINAEVSAARADRKRVQFMVYAVIDKNVFVAALLTKNNDSATVKVYEVIRLICDSMRKYVIITT